MALTKVKGTGLESGATSANLVGIDDNATSTAITIDSSENVGIGVTSPTNYNSNADNLVIYEAGDNNGITLVADNDQGSNIYFADPEDNNVGGITYSHVSNGMIFRTNGVANLSITSSGNVGIGTSSPSDKLHINGGGLIVDKTNNGYSGTRFHDDSAGDYNSYIDLGRNQSGTRLTIRKGGRTQGTTPWANATATPVCSFARGGIAFGSDTAAANTLDDYETGTWTPTVSGGGTLSVTINNATYTKIGDMVTVWCHVGGGSNGDGTTLVFSGLPFTSVNVNGNDYHVGSPIDFNNSNATITNPHTRVGPGSSLIYFYENGSSNINQGQLDVGHLIFTITYKVV